MEFKKELVKPFHKHTSVRNVFKSYLKEYIGKLSVIKNDIERMGISQVVDKDVFLQDDYQHHILEGESYGRGLCVAENQCLFDAISEGCEKIPGKDLDPALFKAKESFKEDEIFILTSNEFFYTYLDRSERFKPKNIKTVSKIEKVRSFAGWYGFSDIKIPVFRIFLKNLRSEALILNKSKVGKLIQFSPKNTDKDSVEDIFHMDIQSFSENNELITNLTKNPPNWLNKIAKKEDHLREKVWIKIFERLEYQRSKDFKGYKIVVREQ